MHKFTHTCWHCHNTFEFTAADLKRQYSGQEPGQFYVSYMIQCPSGDDCRYFCWFLPKQVWSNDNMVKRYVTSAKVICENQYSFSLRSR